MSKKRLFLFDGSNGAAEMLVVILKHYSSVAYPMGGSDCAAASREALQAIAMTLHQAQQASELAEISRRQRPILKSAVKWFYTQSEYALPDDETMDSMYKTLTDKLS